MLYNTIPGNAPHGGRNQKLTVGLWRVGMFNVEASTRVPGPCPVVMVASCWHEINTMMAR